VTWQCFEVKGIRQGEPEKTESGRGTIRHLYYTLPEGREVKFKELPIGAMWHSSIQPNYHGQNAGPCVLLPGRVVWNMSEPGTNGHLWTVSGGIPNVTATPSINYVGIYHGWVTGGVVSDDVDGRKFDQMGNMI
jgi:hypothetical protein